MMPVLRPGAIILVRGRNFRLYVGAVVIIRHGGLEKVKRIGQLHGSRLFVEGDNPQHSTDSRSFGWLDVSTVCGCVMWPRTDRKKTEAV